MSAGGHETVFSEPVGLEPRLPLVRFFTAPSVRNTLAGNDARMRAGVRWRPP